MRYPYTLYKVKSKAGTVWHARLWDETLKKYAHSRSTGIPVEGKKERRKEAEDAAKKIYDEFTATRTATSGLSTAIKKVADTPLIEYLKNFWTEESEYSKFKRDVEKTPLTPTYVENNHNNIRCHVEEFPLFQNLTLGELTKPILRKYLIWLAGRRKTRIKKDGTIADYGVITGRRANTILQSIRVAVRYAVDNEELPTDPFRKLGEVHEIITEKGILTFAERDTLINLPIIDYRKRLVMLLGCFCGLRRGEMRALKWGDILPDGLINIQHSYNNKQGLKPPKYNSKRKVPITSPVQKLLDIARIQAEKLITEETDNPDTNITPNTFIFLSPKLKGKPLSNNFFRFGVEKELSDIGISIAQQVERNITPHSLRHTFITLAQLSGIPDVEIRALSGQKSERVMNQYSHVPQVIDFAKARARLESKINTSDLPLAVNA